jgi:hypothetical protein
VGVGIIDFMSLTLLQHWRESLRSGPEVCAKVFRFLLQFYGDRAMGIAFPSPSPPTPAFASEVDTRPKLPKSPEQIRSLLVGISEAVHAALGGNR